MTSKFIDLQKKIESGFKKLFHYTYTSSHNLGEKFFTKKMFYLEVYSTVLYMKVSPRVVFLFT